MDATRQKALIALVGVALSSSVAAWDGADCADMTERLKRAARDAEDAGQSLADAKPTQREIRDARDQVESALADVESYLERAKRDCGVQNLPRLAVRRELALQQIAAWEKTKRIEPQYDRVNRLMQPHVSELIKTLPPESWLPAMKIMYRALAAP